MRPDRRLFTKALLVLGITTAFVLLAGALTHLAVTLADPPEAETIRSVVWLALGGSLLLTWLITVPVAWLWIDRLSYEVTDESVLVHKGVLTKVDQNIPLRMVTDFRLHRSLLDRWLGIGALDVQTAGQSANATGYEARLAGLVEWQRVHGQLTALLQHVPAAAPPGSSDDRLGALLAEVHEIRQLLETSRAG
jgi:putative membrane protein